jgi:hypothetical protein
MFGSRRIEQKRVEESCEKDGNFENKKVSTMGKLKGKTDKMQESFLRLRLKRSQTLGLGSTQELSWRFTHICSSIHSISNSEHLLVS